MKLSVRRALAVTLALTSRVEAGGSPLNARNPAPIVDEIDSSQDGGAAQEDTITKLVWVRDEPPPSTFIPTHSSSKHTKSSTNTRHTSGPGGPPSDIPSSTSNSRVEKTQISSSRHHSESPPPPGHSSSGEAGGSPPSSQGPGPSTQNPPPPETSTQPPGPPATSKTKTSSGGPLRPPHSSRVSESSTRQTNPASETSQQPPPSGPHSGNGSTPPSTRTPGPSDSQGPTASPRPTDSTNPSSAMSITSGAHTSTGAPIIRQTTIQVTNEDGTSNVVFTGTSVTTSEGSEPTFAWGCSQDQSDICGAAVVPVPGGTGHCVVPLLCPKADNWGFGGGWVPAGSPPPGGPNPPPVDPEEPDSDSSSDEPETSTDPTSTDTSTSSQGTTTTPTTVSTTRSSTSSTATSTSKSKDRLCLTVHEGTGSAEPTQTATTTSKPRSSSSGSSTSSRATTTPASKVRMCLEVHLGSDVPESTQTATTSKPRSSSTKSSTSSRASTTSAAKVPLCLSIHEGSGSASSSSAASTKATTRTSMETTTTSPMAPSTRTHSSLPAPTSSPSTFSTATKTSEHSLCHPSSNPRGPSSCMCTSGSTQIYVPTLTGSDMCGYTKLPETTPTAQTTENTPTVTMPTPFVTTDSDHHVTSCDSATPSVLKAAGQTFTYPACAGNKYKSPDNGIFMAMYSPSGFGLLQWRSFFIGHNDKGEWDTPKFCDSDYLTSDDSSNEYKVSDPPFPEGTFTIGDKMPDGNPQDCEYTGTKDEAGKLKCWGREFECKEWRLDDGTEVCYGISASIYGPKVLCKFPDENGKLVGA